MARCYRRYSAPPAPGPGGRAPFSEAVLDRQRRGLLDVRRLRLLRRGVLEAEHLLELARLVHLGDDVAAADELAVDEELRDRGPVGQGRELLADAGIGEDVDGREWPAERLQDRHRAGGEAARGLLGRALHEQDHGVLVDRA